MNENENENENIENTDQQEDAQSCCASGSKAGKMKYVAFGIIMLLAVGVAANALIEKQKKPAASTCGTNVCTISSDQTQSSDACGSKSSCDSAPKKTSSSCPSQKADAATCSKDSATSGCPFEKKSDDSETCSDKAATCSDKAATCSESKACGEK